MFHAGLLNIGGHMVSIPKMIGLMSCSFVLCLSLSNASQAAERMAPDPCADRKGGQPDLVKCDEERRAGIDTIKGQLSRIDRDTYFIKKYDGKEATMHVDSTTQMYGNIREGDAIEAKTQNLVGDQKHALSIRPGKPENVIQ
jgi:hypothetical protein